MAKSRSDYLYFVPSTYLKNVQAHQVHQVRHNTCMIRTFLKSKIHRATVTEAELHYEGSVSIDEALLELADIHDHEQVDIYNITRGTRLTTYAIIAERHSGRICINGAAAHLMEPGDMVIICSYAQVPEEDLPHTPVVVKVDEQNHPVSTD